MHVRYTPYHKRAKKREGIRPEIFPVFFSGQRAQAKNMTEDDHFSGASITMIYFYNRIVRQLKQMKNFLLHTFKERNLIFLI
jgi:hypothetical protein